MKNMYYIQEKIYIHLYLMKRYALYLRGKEGVSIFNEKNVYYIQETIILNIEP